MLIEWVRLKNIKSHADTEVQFADGVNAVAGKTGAGKSSILEAVGFALFDHLPYSHSDFVREGEKSGLIEVGIRSRLDGNPYTVVRGCGQKSEWLVLDPAKSEPEDRLVTGKEDTTDWLREHLKVGLEGPSAIPLSVLFQEAIGVPQGLFTAPFLQTPAQRKKVFAPLLGMDDYDKAYENLRETETHLKGLKIELEKEEAGLVPQIERLPALQAELVTLRETVERNQAGLALMDEEIRQLEVEKTVLSDRKKRIDELASKVERLTTEIATFERELTLRRGELNVATEAKVLVVGSTDDYQTFLAVKKLVAEVLEVKKLESDRLRDSAVVSEKSLASLSAERIGIEERLQTLGNLEAELAELQPLVKAQEEMEKGVMTLRLDAERLINLQESLLHERKRLEEVKTELVAAEQGVVTYRELEAQIEALTQARASAQSDQVVARTRLDSLKKDGEELKAKMERFEAGETGPCPFCRQEVTPEHKHNALDEYARELAGLRTGYKSENERLKQAEAALKLADEQIAAARERIKGLATPGLLESLKTRVAPQAQVVEKLEADIATLDASVKDRATLHVALRDLGDPRSRHAICLKNIEEKRAVEAKLAVNEKALNATEASVAEIKRKLADLGNVDADLAAARETMAKCEKGYQIYVANEKAASKVKSCEQSVSELASKIESSTKELNTSKEGLTRELAGQSTGMIETRLQTYETGLREATAKRSVLSAETDTAKRRIVDQSAEAEALQMKETRLAEVRKELSQNAKISSRLGFVRSGIRQAGPRVVRAMTGIVSLEASIAFSDIVKNHGMTLGWNEDYGITVEQNGKKRAFTQLSGGEQMSAALAVRLALLKEMTGIDAVFFDEPTPHMDSELRENLAEQITRIRGLSQIVVISHDDTFERITEHVVKVQKGTDISSIDRADDPYFVPRSRQPVVPAEKPKRERAPRTRKAVKRSVKAASVSDETTPDAEVGFQAGYAAPGL